MDDAERGANATLTVDWRSSRKSAGPTAVRSSSTLIRSANTASWRGWTISGSRWSKPRPSTRTRRRRKRRAPGSESARIVQSRTADCQNAGRPTLKSLKSASAGAWRDERHDRLRRPRSAMSVSCSSSPGGATTAAGASSSAAPATLVYALSLAVYCTSWTYYGSVGLASAQGLDFLPIYIGPILVVGFGYRLIARIAALARAQNLTTVADFVVRALRQVAERRGARGADRADRPPRPTSRCSSRRSPRRS